MSAIIVSALFAHPSHAAEKQRKAAAPAPVKTIDQTMQYDVYAGGFHVVAARLDVALAKKTGYLLRLAATTHGFLGKLVQWKGTFQTKGWYDAKKSFPKPELHFSDTTWSDEHEITTFHYNKDGTFREYHIKNTHEDRIEPPAPGLADNSIDVLTATLRVLNSLAQGGKCAGTSKVFDGQRSYNLVFTEQEKVTLKATELNVYAGPATECTIEVKPIAGKWHEKPRGWMSIQEQGRERGTMPTIWLAQMVEGAPAVPVKIRVKTQYGTLFMHLTGYQGGGKSLKLAE